MTVLAAGQLIAERYELTNRIAVGGMGEVWEADDTRLGRSVAVKILRPELSGDDEFRHRFRIEARTVASLDHPGIAHVHDYGEDEDAAGRRTAYLVMELVRGEPLSTVVARGPMSTDEALRIVEQAAWALHAAHERGFVHRDVKPGNILIGSDGRVKLTDFGIAKAANAVPMTRSGMVMGTAHYIAPEQATGGEAGPTGDVYSLGIVGYECLTGRRPFRGDSAVEVAAMQVRDAPPPLPDTVPVHVRTLIEAVLAKDPALRYATGEEFAEAVAAVRRGEAAPLPLGSGSAGTATRAPAPAELPKRRRRWIKADPEPPRHARGKAAASVEPIDVPPVAEPTSSGPAGAVPAAVEPAAPPATPRPMPRPYAAPPATPQPYPAPRPYAAPPVTPRPYPKREPQPYAAPPATPRPYAAPPATPQARPRPYAAPPATPQPYPQPYAEPTATPQPYPQPYAEPTATPPPRPMPEPRLPTPPPSPASRTPYTQNAPPPAPSARTPAGGAKHVAPLNVTPRSGLGRTFLLVLFVLLTVAAVVVGYLVFVRGVIGTGGTLGASGTAPTDTAPNLPTASASASTVTGREDVLVGWAAAGAPLIAMITGRGVQWAGPTVPPARPPAQNHPFGRRSPA